ncbi:hypothetical protein EON63_12290 [archaeon]|nr:MAG: hypothetical protein EON63_12290 [archaeon]
MKVKSRQLGEINTRLPKKGWSKKEVLAIMKKATEQEDVVWEEGNVSGKDLSCIHHDTPYILVHHAPFIIHHIPFTRRGVPWPARSH